jgi:CRP-like cAMP-binding protein
MRILADGRRQIMCLLLPGDLIGFAALRPSMAAHATVAAITNVELADAETLRSALESSELNAWNGLKEACRAAARLDECGLLEQIVRLGRKTAYERVADFLLEMHWRLRLAGLAKGEDFEMPLTQEQIADILGLSNVHVNRTLQQLRRDGLLELGGGRARFLERRLLEEYADFRPPLEQR